MSHVFFIEYSDFKSDVFQYGRLLVQVVRRQLQASTDEVVARQRVHGVAARRHERVEGERLLRTSSLTEPDYDPEGQEESNFLHH